MYDFILDSIGALIRNGWSVSTAALVIVLFFKQRKMRRRLRKYLPFLFQDDSEVKEYIQNQQVIMQNQKRIMDRLGVEPWGVDSHGTTSKPSSEKTGFMSSWPGKSVVHSAAKSTIYPILKGRVKMNKFKSRKFWLAVVSAALVIANDGLDLGVNNETVMAFAAIVVGWIFGESYIDAKKVKTNEIDESGISVESEK